MGERFLRCPFCGQPHEAHTTVCPNTQRRLIDVHETAHAAPPMSRRVPGPAPERIPHRPARHSEGRTAVAGMDRGIIGQMIDGKYVVRSVLGEGGMGAVYEAEHIALARPVAVKVLHPQQARKTVAVKRFHQEARAAGAIGHPNICEVYDLGTLADGSPYLVMERLVGRTLADRIAEENGLPFDDVVDIVAQVLAGLSVAHEKGIVHRDIKPENIFLCERPGIAAVAKLLDFGVSKMMAPVLSGERDEEMDLTRTGMVMGTPFYMSPEQARGDRDLDGRVDLFACGVILYEALTGRRPFIAANYNALLLQILTATPKPLRELRPSTPAGFERVVARALERDRAKRYQTALEFQWDLLALRERSQSSRSVPPPAASVVARQALGIRPPAAPRVPTGNVSGHRLREVVPPPVTPSSVDVPVDFEGRAGGSDRPMDFGDDAPTEVTADPRFYEDDDGATQVRSDGREMLRAVRSARSYPPPRPAAGTPPPPPPPPPVASPPASPPASRPAQSDRRVPPPFVPRSARDVPPPPPPGAEIPAVGGFGSDDDATRIDPKKARLDSSDDPTEVIDDEGDLRAKLR